MTTLYLARHGQTEENVQQILQGHLPGHLTDWGKQQAEALALRVRTCSSAPSVILVSDLERTLRTAEIVNEVLHLPLVKEPLLRERDWGSLTGLPCDYARHLAQLPADTETVEQLFNRAERFIQQVLTQYPDKMVLAIGHGLFNRCIRAAWEGVRIADIPRMQNGDLWKIELTIYPLKPLHKSDDTISDA